MKNINQLKKEIEEVERENNHWLDLIDKVGGVYEKGVMNKKEKLADFSKLPEKYEPVRTNYLESKIKLLELKAKLQTLQEVCEEILKFRSNLLSLYPLKEGEPIQNVFDRDRIKEIFEELLKKFQGEELNKSSPKK